MFGKLTDTANLLKAKITKDDLEQKLVQATSEQNWQTSSNILHDIANAAHNYQKWQKINDFISDKLKRKNTWRKVLKTLNLIDFLLKNGPPSIVSSFKYDIYQFRTFSDYQHYQDGLDRGQSIRQKSKHLVQLLSNDQLLEQEREKAKKIRQKMASIVGGSSMNYGGGGYGGYGGDSKYQNFDSKSYAKNSSKTQSYGLNNPFGTYGDYNYNKSTLDKYKGGQSKNKTVSSISTSNNNQTSITPQSKPSIVPSGQNTTEKKPFSKLAPKLIKPPSKSEKVSSSQVSQPQPPKKTQNILDDDIFDAVGSTPSNTTNPQPVKNQQISTDIGFSFDPINTQDVVKQQSSPVQQTKPLQNYSQNTHQNPPQQLNAQNLYQNQQINQQYQGYPPQQQNYQMNSNYGPMNYNNPQYNTNQFRPAYQQPQYVQQPQYAQQPPQTFYHQTYTQSNNSQVPQQNNIHISLSDTKKEQSFGNFESANSQAAKNVGWLSNNQKGLIDFSDFSSQIKAKSNSQQKVQQSNNIQLDGWNW